MEGWAPEDGITLKFEIGQTYRAQTPPTEDANCDIVPLLLT